MLGHKVLLDYAMAEAKRLPVKSALRPEARKVQIGHEDEARRPALAA